MVRSQRVISSSDSETTGFNTVRGDHGISVMQQSIAANTVAAGLGISGYLVGGFADNGLWSIEFKNIFDLREYGLSGDANSTTDYSSRAKCQVPSAIPQ